MSDRLPSRRRRSGGRHAAPRRQPTALRLPTGWSTPLPARRLAQGAVAVGLVLSTGAVVVTATAEEPRTTLLADGRDEEALARQAEDRAAMVRTEQLRSEAVAVASDAIAQASAVRADAEQVAVAPEVLAELDAATAELQAAITSVDVAPLSATDAVADRGTSVSRAADRDTATPAPTTDPVPTADEPAPTASADPTAVPADPTAVPADPTAVPADPTAVPADPAADAAAADATLTAEDPAATTTTVPDSGDPATGPLREALERVARASDAAKASAEQKRAEAAAVQAAADEAARVAAEQAAQRAAWKASLQGFDNGEVPESALCGVSFDRAVRLRCDAAEALEALDAAFAARFGKHLDVSDSYRSYSQQVACRANKGSLCARPGTSNHGMGVAVDLGGAVQSFGTAEHVWMRENAPAHDWTLPDWARAGGSKPEPWHWEYVG